MNKEDSIRLYHLRKKNPSTAALLSLVITGAGHLYVGKVGAGFALLFLQIALWFILLGWVVWIVAPIDAHRAAKTHNEDLMLSLGLSWGDVA